MRTPIMPFTRRRFLKTVLGSVWLVGVWAIAPHLNQASFPWILIVLGSVSLWLEEIAKIKMPDLNANDVDAAMKIVAGTARSMGIEVE